MVFLQIPNVTTWSVFQNKVTYIIFMYHFKVVQFGQLYSSQFMMNATLQHLNADGLPVARDRRKQKCTFVYLCVVLQELSTWRW